LSCSPCNKKSKFRITDGNECGFCVASLKKRKRHNTCYNTIRFCFLRGENRDVFELNRYEAIEIIALLSALLAEMNEVTYVKFQKSKEMLRRC